MEQWGVLLLNLYFSGTQPLCITAWQMPQLQESGPGTTDLSHQGQNPRLRTGWAAAAGTGMAAGAGAGDATGGADVFFGGGFRLGKRGGVVSFAGSRREGSDQILHRGGLRLR